MLKGASVLIRNGDAVYRVTGTYYGGCSQTGTQEYEPPRFEIHHLEGLNGADTAPLLDDVAGLESRCIRQYQEDVAWSEQAAMDTKLDYRKEQAA